LSNIANMPLALNSMTLRGLWILAAILFHEVEYNFSDSGYFIFFWYSPRLTSELYSPWTDHKENTSTKQIAKRTRLPHCCLGIDHKENAGRFHCCAAVGC
jgi:hypothetical protein